VATLRGAPVTGRTTVGSISTSLAVVAAISAILTVIFGGMALDFAESAGFSSDIAEIHEGLGEAVAVTLTVWALLRIALWWRNTHLKGALAMAMPLTAIAAVCLVTATAYYGGQLVYDLGVNVAKLSG
jgi:uncharacterized membrane protein